MPEILVPYRTGPSGGSAFLQNALSVLKRLIHKFMLLLLILFRL